jgi:hypothetical protein
MVNKLQQTPRYFWVLVAFNARVGLEGHQMMSREREVCEGELQKLNDGNRFLKKRKPSL